MVASVAWLWALGCRDVASPAAVDAPVTTAADAPLIDAPLTADPDGPAGEYPPPDDDLVPAVGSASTLEVGAWNIENFPCGQAPGCRDNTEATIKVVADIIASMEIDVLAVEEIASVEAWNELLARLPGYEGRLSAHTYNDGTYQKVGVIFRTSVVSVPSMKLLFNDSAHDYDLPRPPLELQVAVNDAEVAFTMIVVHLKAGTGYEDQQRRRAASELLEQHVYDLVSGGDSNVIVLGDFNNEIDSDEPEERMVLDAWLSRPDSYTFATQALADGGAFSFVPSHVLLDQIVTTASLVDERAGGTTVIPRLDQAANIFNYVDGVSDHLPVATTMPIF